MRKLLRERLPKVMRERELYSPLDDSRSEIRLVTIEPEQPDGLVRCKLHHVSLKDIKHEYSLFGETADQGTARQLTNKWIRSRSLSNNDKPPDAGARASAKPPCEQQRYVWGDFAALSYVWGNPHVQQNIMLNGTLFPVTANLEIALRSLGRSNEFQDEYKIWIDAICINQNDDIERARQVSKMRDIYGGALSVIAWLGEADSSMEIPLVFQFLRDLAVLAPHEQEISVAIANGRLTMAESVFFSLHELMIRAYWSRLWIVQEVVMGGSATVLRCDLNTLDWTTFTTAITVLYNGNNWTLKDTYLLQERARRKLMDIGGWRTMSLHLVQQDLRLLCVSEESGGARLGLRRLLEIAGAADCRDVRDRCVALSGMMEPKIAAEITGHYNESVSSLFAAATRAFICYYNNLEPLRHANPWGEQKAPTWAVDWTWNGRMRWSRPETEFAGPLCYPLEAEPRPEAIYKAHAGIVASYAFSTENHTILRCQGFICDKIGGLGAREDGYFDWAPHSLQQFPSWRSIYGDDRSTAMALSRALIGGCITKGIHAQDRHVAVLSLPSTFQVAEPQFRSRGWQWLTSQGGYYFKWQYWRRGNDAFLLGPRTIGSYFSDTIPDDADEQTFMEVYTASNRTVMERRFMLTTGGRFGWAPDNAYSEEPKDESRIGDLIAIVFGCSTPLVVRPMGDDFIVVGEAYVEGWMQGEAVSALQNGGFQSRTFTFR